MNNADATAVGPEGGRTRLAVVIAVAYGSFVAQSMLHYLLPIYFPAVGMPRSSWETWSLYEIAAWLVIAPTTGLLAARFGERIVWAAGLVGYAAVGGSVALLPHHAQHSSLMLGACGLLWGASSAVIWVGGISLAQKVPERQRGKANALIMVAFGAGGISGPLVGRYLMHRSTGVFSLGVAFNRPLLVFCLISLLASGLMHAFGQSSGRPTDATADLERKVPPTRLAEAIRGSLRLFRDPKYVILVVSLSLLGGPIFQATNVYRPYRVRDREIGLMVGAEDHGWAALEATGNIMQLLGGILVGFAAGRRASTWVAAGALAAFALCGLGIGLAPNALLLFCFSALFELARQFMRWVQTGYVSEGVSSGQRTQAIGFSVTLSGIGAWAFNLLMRRLQSPDAGAFSSALPFVIAALCGGVGVAILCATQRTSRFMPVGADLAKIL